MKWTHNNRTLSDRRKELRKNQTKAEEILWFELRNNKLGAKFKRQHSIGGYIADFYCHTLKLVIEIDGGIHKSKEQREYDYAIADYSHAQSFPRPSCTPPKEAHLHMRFVYSPDR